MPPRHQLLLPALTAGIAAIGVAAGALTVGAAGGPATAVGLAAGGFLGNVASDWTAAQLQAFYGRWSAGWFSARGALHPALLEALARSFAHAVRQLEQDWQAQPHFRHLQRSDKQAAAATLQPLRWLQEDAGALIAQPDQLAQALSGSGANLLAAHDADAARHEIGQALANYLHGHDQELIRFVGERLASEWQRRFFELLEGSDDLGARSRRAFQRLLQQTLLAAVEAIGQDTAAIREAAGHTIEGVQRLLERVQPSVDPAQQLADALALLASLPLEDIPVVSPLPPGSRMPFSANPLFVGREEDLRALAAILQAGSTAAVGQVAAATGLGGIGKTQLAVEFAHRYGRFFAGGVFWLSFADSNAIPAEAAACGLTMGLPGLEGLDLPDQVQWVRSAWQQPMPRLLIFDNCEEEELLARWRPATGGCWVLLTSRRQAWPAALNVRPLPLPVLPRAESVALLRSFRAYQAGDEPVLEAIAAELGDLPLALHLAGNFLASYRHDVAPAAYLQQLQRPDLLGHRSLTAGDYSPTAHDTHVARTFALSYDRLDPDDAVDGLAQALLARLACFAPGEPAPRDLLLLTVDRAGDSPDYQAGDALHRLAALGLVDEQEDGSLVMHRLVAAFVLALPGAQEAQQAVEEALVNEAGRLNETGLPALLLPWQGHLRHSTDRALPRGDMLAARLCNELGYHLQQAGDLTGARPYYEQGLAIRRQALGEVHPDTATSLNNLGSLLQAMGDLPGARPYLEQALAIRRQALGDVHPDTAQSISSLGYLLRAIGDLSAARPYYEQTLAIWRQSLGEAHPYTAASLSNLGLLLHDMGELPTARTYHERALAIRRQVLGEDHPGTASSLNSLGILIQAMGDLPAARPYLEQALAIRRQAFGEGHPTTAESLNNFGMLLEDMGELAAARPYLEQALAVRRQTLGEVHPLTALGLSNLGGLLHDLGDFPGARLHYEQALAIRHQALGEAHPETAQSLNNLGLVLKDMGDLPAARPYLEQALAIRRQALGEAHPITAGSFNNVGRLLKDMGDLLAARPYLERALAIWSQTLGETHPLTAFSLNNLGVMLQAMGELPAAQPYLEQALAIRRQTLGEAHPDTALSLNNLGSLLLDMGDRSAAQLHLEQALAIRRQALGEAHPHTAESLSNLGRLLQAMDDPAAARPYYEQALAVFEASLGPDHPDTQAVRNSLEGLLDELGM